MRFLNFLKNTENEDPISRGADAVRSASKLAQLIPFCYLLGSSADGSVSFSQYTGVFVEKDKVSILSEEEREAVAVLLSGLRNKAVK